MSYYAVTDLTARSARTGRSARRIHAFATRSERDAFVANYPTNDCEAIRARDLTARERTYASPFTVAGF
jgi:hypothetical protein